jgi:hypothetical protein
MTNNGSTGYPANLKVRYRISERILHSTFKYLVKLEINKHIICIEGFLFRYRYIKLVAFLIFYAKAIKVSRRHFWKFYNLI